MSQEFLLPDVGEGLTEAEVVLWHVKVGDTVALNAPVVDIETAKAVVELPCPYAGTVLSLLVEVGTSVPVGTSLLVVGDPSESADASSSPAPEAAEPSAELAPPAAEPAAAAVPEPEVAAEDKPAVLVGPGPKAPADRRRRLGANKGSGVAASPVPSAPATPSATPASPAAQAMAPVAAPLFADGSRETRIPVKGVRKVTAEAMVRSAFTAPHVTEWLAVDVTPTMDLVERLKSDRAWSDVRMTPLILVARAFVQAVRMFPAVNATWDDQNQEIVVKDYVNLGIAAATPRGLIVPNIKDAHLLGLRDLANAMTDLVSVARSGKTPPADMAGGTVTITNIGALGVDAGTPILNPGESAILAFGNVRPTPWVVGSEIQIRQVTQLALSFDHRLIDGNLGSRVLARTGELLADPWAAVVRS